MEGGKSAAVNFPFIEVVFLVEKTFILSLDDGSDVIRELEKFVRENEMEYCLLVSGSGKIKEFELILHEPNGGLNRARFENEFELNALSGKIQKAKDGKINTNIKVSVTSTGVTPKAGQMVSGKAAGVLEISVRKVGFGGIIEA